MSADLAAKVKNLPHKAGIYKFKNKDGQIIYVGKAKDLKSRVSSYFQKSSILSPKTVQLASEIVDLDFIIVESEFEALLLEARLITDLKPFYNIIARDDKSFLYIKIDKRVPVPIVETARKRKAQRGVFLVGPFPSSRTVRSVLRWVRHTFPYCTHKKAVKSCLYAHLGLCPYPWSSEESRREYLKAIGGIILLLSGKSKGLMRQLLRDMETAARQEDFEGAAQIKAQVEQINYVTQSFHLPEDYLTQPDLVAEMAQERITKLQEILGLPNLPRRIECYDISNISGKFATGSMVVFADGMPDKSQYRRFRIRKTTKGGGPDDFAMIAEVIERRLNNDWPRADLMVIDGGKGQLSAAVAVVSQKEPNLKVIALAKRIEEIFVPGLEESLVLSKDSPTLTLVRAIRDEAHRFAIAYHRKLRSKNLLETLTK